MDFINYTEILGDTLIELGFEKHKFDDDGRYKYTKVFSFGKFYILDGNSHFKDSVFVDGFNKDSLTYLNDKPKTLTELVQLIAKISYNEGIESGKRSKIYEIKSVLEME
jgi:hypothetical protein